MVVEVRDELIQIPLQTIPGNPLECVKQKGLEVTNGDVYPWQPLVHLVRFSHASLMFLALFQSLQRYQSVGTGVCLGRRHRRANWRIRSAEAALVFHDNLDWCLALGTSSALPTRPASSDKGVFQFHHAL